MYKVKKKETFIPSSNGKDKLHVIVQRYVYLLDSYRLL